MAKEKEEIDQMAIQSEAQESPMETTEAPMTLRKYREMIKARYPDENPQTDEEWADLEDRYAEETEGVISNYKDSEMTLNEVMTAYPELASILHDIVVNKLPVRAAIAKHFEQEDLIPQEGDPDYPEFDAVLKEKQGAKEKKSALDKEIEDNMDQSIKSIDAFCEQKGYDDTQKQTLLDFIESTFQDLLMKKVTENILDAFNKAMSYDKDLAMAEEAGEIKGKNTAIEAKMAKVDEQMGDGIPDISKGGTMREVEPGVVQKHFGDIGKRKGI
jgi:hypothetical protein